MAIRLIKGVKVVILLGLVAQVFVPVVLPLWPESALIRWIGAFVFAAGWMTAVAGRVPLGSNWSNIETPDVLTEQRVISHGVYRYIRHPIYVGDLLLLFGLEIALNSWLVIGPLLLAPVVLAKATREENMLRKRLPGYRKYCRNSKRFVPYVV